MSDIVGENLEDTVIILTPTGKDALLTRATLAESGISSVITTDFKNVCEHLEKCSGALLISEEAIGHDNHDLLAEWLTRQPPWSDIPILILSRPGADSNVVNETIKRWGNVTVLERPMRLTAFVSAIQTALRARQRQYQLRTYVAQHIESEKKLREADSRKDEFLAILAHELRNPLAPICNNLEILRLQSRGEASTINIIEMMERQVHLMVRLVDDLMEISRLTRGIVQLNPINIDITSIIIDSIEISRPFIDAAKHKLDITLPDEPLYLKADRFRLAQVFSNLLNNSAKYTSRGGHIWLKVQGKANEIIIRVQDTGQGIPPDMLTNIFVMFRQLDNVSGQKPEGLGIGLTLVKNLVEMHGGNIEARSKGIGTGSEFIVRLPRISQSVTSELEKKYNGLPRSTLRRVLVVDDNQDAANSLSTMLNLFGIESRCVFSGADALETLESFLPDFVVMDIGMPEMDGYVVARRIRNDPRYNSITLVALTGWGQKKDQLQAQLAGFDHHMSKPADIPALRKLLSGSPGGSGY